MYIYNLRVKGSLEVLILSCGGNSTINTDIKSLKYNVRNHMLKVFGLATLDSIHGQACTTLQKHDKDKVCHAHT